MLRHNQRSATRRLPLWTLSIHQISKYTPRWNIYDEHSFRELAHASFRILNLGVSEGSEEASCEITSEKDNNNNRFYLYIFFLLVYLFFFFFSFFTQISVKVVDEFKCVCIFDIYVYILIFVTDLWTVETKINTKVSVQKFRSRLVYLVIRNNWGSD